MFDAENTTITKSYHCSPPLTIVKHFYIDHLHSRAHKIVKHHQLTPSPYAYLSRKPPLQPRKIPYDPVTIVFSSLTIFFFLRTTNHHKLTPSPSYHLRPTIYHLPSPPLTTKINVNRDPGFAENHPSTTISYIFPIHHPFSTLKNQT